MPTRPARTRRTHSDEQILVAVRDLLLAYGPRGVTTAAVSQRSGAPTGSLYHRFGSRAIMVAELWVRTIRGFHAELFDATAHAAPGMDRALAAVRTIVQFASRHPDDARLMLIANREEFEADPSMPSELVQSLRHLNQPVEVLLRQLSEELYGKVTVAGLDRVSVAVLGLPYAAVRRRLLQGSDPGRLTPMVEAAARSILKPPTSSASRS